MDLLGLTNTDAISDVARGPGHAEPTTERIFDMNNDADMNVTLSMTQDCWSAERLIECIGTMDALDVLENGVITPSATVMLTVGNIIAMMTQCPMSVGIYAYTDETPDEPRHCGVFSGGGASGTVSAAQKATEWMDITGWLGVSAYWRSSGYMLDMDTLTQC